MRGRPWVVGDLILVLEVPAVLYDVVRSAEYHAFAEEVAAVAYPAKIATFLIGHFFGLAQPAGETAVGCMPTSTAHSEAVAPQTIAQYTLAHSQSDILFYSIIFNPP